MKTVVGLYDELSDARNVVQDLVNADFNREDISVIFRDPEGEYAASLEEREELVEEPAAEAAVEGAVAGGVIGGLAGVVLGLGVFAIPGLGPVVAAGPLIAGLVGASVGAVGGGLLGALVEAGVPEEEAEYYVEGVRRGSTLVAVKTAEERVEDVIDIMSRRDVVDIERRAATWEFEPDADEYEAYEAAYRRHYDSVYAETTYAYEDYEPAYRYGYDLATDARYRDRDWGEVEPEARRSWETENEGAWNEFKDAIREGWEEVQDAFDADEWHDVHNYNYADYEPSFRRHYEAYYADDHPYNRYAPAYRYGYHLATDTRYRDRDWEDVEPEARHRWQTEHEGAWNEFKDAVRHAWDEVTEAFDGDHYDDDFDTYGPTFRRHYDTYYATSNYPYSRYEPAYYLGYELGRDSRYQDRDWDQVEPEARRHWEVEHDDAWDEFKDAVRHAWHKVKTSV